MLNVDADRIHRSPPTNNRDLSLAHNPPIIKNAEQCTFNKAAQALVDEYTINNRKSVAVMQRRITKHLTPYFGGWRMASIKTGDVAAYIVHRRALGIIAHRGTRKGERIGQVSNAEINRELQTLKRIFNLAIEQDRIAMKPTIKLLQESAARAGFFEPEQITSVLTHLPAEIQPVIRFAYYTGWENRERGPTTRKAADGLRGRGSTAGCWYDEKQNGRVIYMTTDLRHMLEAQYAEHERLKKAGHIFPNVFFREVADERGGAKHPKVITSFTKAWRIACRKAGCPGRIPHDLRRTAVRNFVRSGIPERVAMRLTGHKTASVFQRYNIVSDGDLREAAIKMNVAEGR